MKDNQLMNVRDFMDMFILVNYLRENRCINIDVLKQYIIKVSAEKPSSFFDLLNMEIDLVLDEMISRGIISYIPNYEYLIKIHDPIPIKEFFSNKLKYLSLVTKFVNDFINYNFSVDKDKYQLVKERI